MNYKQIYQNIIDKSKLQCRSKKDSYFEKHHIIPKSMGGDNSKDLTINDIGKTYKEIGWYFIPQLPK